VSSEAEASSYGKLLPLLDNSDQGLRQQEILRQRLLPWYVFGQPSAPPPPGPGPSSPRRPNLAAAPAGWFGCFAVWSSWRR
jgi:hypothetical protein